METNHKEFKPFDKVLVRDGVGYEWYPALYALYDSKYHVTINGEGYEDDNILAYEGNEHLVGKVDKSDEEVKLEEGEFLFVAKKLYYNNIELWAFVRHYQVLDKEFKTQDGLYWNYAVKFSDFNPNDMEETMKHILCVKDCKVVKYKG